jgi:hypothetical protein
MGVNVDHYTFTMIDPSAYIPKRHGDLSISICIYGVEMSNTTLQDYIVLYAVMSQALHLRQHSCVGACIRTDNPDYGLL